MDEDTMTDDTVTMRREDLFQLLGSLFPLDDTDCAPIASRVIAEVEAKRVHLDAGDLLETAWGIIANVSGGDWGQQSDEWREAAERWRDDGFHAWLDAVRSSGEDVK